MGGEDFFKNHIRAGGLDLGVEGCCDCERPVTDSEAWDLYGQLVDHDDFNRLRDVYNRTPWGSEARSRIRGIVIEKFPECMGSLDASDATAWLHANHERYNTSVRHIISELFGLQRLRKLLVRDLAFERHERGVEQGDLLSKGRSRDLINNFIDTDNWCQRTH